LILTRSAKGAAYAIALTLLTNVLLESPSYADDTRNKEWYLTTLNLPAAQQISNGEGIVVGLLDSGVEVDHPDLLGNVLPGINLLAAGQPTDDFDGHGTAMAGLIAGHGEGKKGILGIAPKAKILPVVVGNPPTLGVASVYMNGGFTWAAQHGARVISASFSADNTAAMRADVQAALDADVVVVAAAGNLPDDTEVAYPAAIPGVVAVGGITRDYTHDQGSVTGDKLLISAPSVQIESTTKHASYSEGTGTSDAVAIVAGVAALIRAKYPTMSAVDVIHLLTATATDKGPPGRDPDYGYGVVNPVAALTANAPPPPASPSHGPQKTATAAPTGGSELNVATLALLGVALLAMATAGLSLTVMRGRRHRT
jgi:type VII secretion-associated serine protease mycosin